jgi:mRNA deadenylase 3'-5' endonuclease subunit Ccr4
MCDWTCGVIDVLLMFASCWDGTATLTWCGNMLCLQQYPYCDSWSLSWPYRRTLLLRELEELQGDVVCLQEMQADYYAEHVSAFMNELGYDGLFKSKTRDFAGNYDKVRSSVGSWCFG